MTQTAPQLFDAKAAWEDFTRLWFLKILTLAWFLLTLAAEGYVIGATWNHWWPYNELNLRSSAYQSVAIYTFAGGAIGATLYAFHGFCVAVGPQRADVKEFHYDPSWTWWYIAWPAIGGFVGALTYVAVRTGVATLGTASTNSTSNLGYFFIATLAGLSSKEALGWLKSKAKDAFGTNGTSGGGAGGGAGGGGAGGGAAAGEAEPLDR